MGRSPKPKPDTSNVKSCSTLRQTKLLEKSLIISIKVTAKTVLADDSGMTKSKNMEAGGAIAENTSNNKSCINYVETNNTVRKVTYNYDKGDSKDNIKCSRRLNTDKGMTVPKKN